jgi:hypothetical protein
MAITPTYSWPLPDDTSLVKDGAEAIRDLGNAIDTTVSGLGAGLVHINTTTFNAVSSQAVTFASATYKNYKIIINWKQTANATLTLRVRSGTSDYSGGEYNNALFFTRSGGTTSGALVNNQNQTSANLIGTTGFDSGVNSINQMEMLVSNIFETTSTSLSTKVTTTDGTGNTLGLFGSHRVRESSSYDGINLILGSGNMTGTIQIFGVKE